MVYSDTSIQPHLEQLFTGVGQVLVQHWPYTFAGLDPIVQPERQLQPVVLRPGLFNAKAFVTAVQQVYERAHATLDDIRTRAVRDRRAKRILGALARGRAVRRRARERGVREREHELKNN